MAIILVVIIDIKGIERKGYMKKIITSAQSRDARAALGLSQNLVSKQTGIGRSYMSQFENEILRLTDSQLTKLRSFYEDEGFIFNDKVSSAELEKVVDRAQEKLAPLAVDNGVVQVNALEMSELLSTLEMIIETGGVSNSMIDTPLVSNDILAGIFSDFEKGNKAFQEYFLLDNEGKIPKKGMFEDRDAKIISLMALQYIRYMTVTTGKSLIDTEFMNSEVLSDGKDAESVSGIISETISESTTIDSYLEELVA